MDEYIIWWCHIHTRCVSTEINLMGTKLVKFFNLEKIKNKSLQIAGRKVKRKSPTAKKIIFSSLASTYFLFTVCGRFFELNHGKYFHILSHTRSNIEFNYFISSSLLIKFSLSMNFLSGKEKS